MMKKRLSIGLILIIMLVSCTKEDRRALIIKQETAIDEFVKTLVADTVYYRNGVVRAVLKSGTSGVEGDTLAPGDSVFFYYAGHLFSNGKGAIFHTNSDSVANVYSWPLSGAGAQVLSRVVGEGKLIKGLDNGMPGMREGERAYIIFNADFGFGNDKVGQIPKMSPLLYEIWLEQIIKK